MRPMSTTPDTTADPATVTPRRTEGRIVVGIDGSAHADKALGWAAGEALRRQATLAVVHTWMPPYPLGRRTSWPTSLRWRTPPVAC